MDKERETSVRRSLFDSLVLEFGVDIVVDPFTFDKAMVDKMRSISFQDRWLRTSTSADTRRARDAGNVLGDSHGALLH